MNTLEDRLTRDLQANDQGIQVSDTDVLHAEHRYLRRRHELTHQAHTRTALVAAAAAVAVVAGGSALLQNLGDPAVAPAGPGPVEPPAPRALPLTRENLAGVWMMVDGWLWAYTNDGDLMWERPTSNLESPNRMAAQTTPYEVTSTEVTLPDEYCNFSGLLDTSGTLRMAVTSETCWAGMGDSWDQVKLSPAAEGMVSLTWSADTTQPGEPVPVKGLDQLRGAWLKQGTGQLLLIMAADRQAPDAVYWIDDGGELFSDPDDEGTLRLTAASTVELVSSSDSADCQAEDTALLSELHGTSALNAPFGRALEIASSVGECSLHTDLEGTWIRVG